jgi:hypothetical protein
LENVIGTGEGNDEAHIASLLSIVDSHFLHATIKSEDLAVLNLLIVDSNVRVVVEDEAGHELGGVNFDRAVSSLWELPGSVEVRASLLGGGRKVFAGDQFGLAFV